MRLIRPLAIADETTDPCARWGTLNSAAYFAAPVTFARPSMREVGLPKCAKAVVGGNVVVAIGAPPLSHPLVRLRLRRAMGRLRQRAQHGAPCQLDLEVVVAEAARAAQHGLGGARKALARRRRPCELRLGVAVAPGLVRHAAEREARHLDRAALDLET